MESLQELSGCGHESGIVLYPESREAVIVNWAGTEGLPRVFGQALVWTPTEIIPVMEFTATSWRDATEGYTFIYDENHDAPEAPDGEARVFVLEGGTGVILPRDWN